MQMNSSNGWRDCTFQRSCKLCVIISPLVKGHNLGISLGFSQFEKTKEKRKRNARLKVDSKNNTRSVTLFPNYFASYFVVIQDPCLRACRVHCFRAFESSMLMLYTVYFSIATTAVAAVYAMQPHGTPLYFEIISSCAVSLHLFCTNIRYKFHECNKRWFWN